MVEEADETVYWLDLIQAGAVCADASLQALRREAAELSTIFNQSQLTAKINAARRKKEATRSR